MLKQVSRGHIEEIQKLTLVDYVQLVTVLSRGHAVLSWTAHGSCQFSQCLPGENSEGMPEYKSLTNSFVLGKETLSTNRPHLSLVVGLGSMAQLIKGAQVGTFRGVAAATEINTWHSMQPCTEIVVRYHYVHLVGSCTCNLHALLKLCVLETSRVGRLTALGAPMCSPARLV